MKHLILHCALALACASLAAPAAWSADRATGNVTPTAVSMACPAGTLDAARSVAVHMQMPVGLYGGTAIAPSMSIAGEIRDFAVAGCTVSFEASAALATLSPAALVGSSGSRPPQRGCRGFCGL